MVRRTDQQFYLDGMYRSVHVSCDKNSKMNDKSSPASWRYLFESNEYTLIDWLSRVWRPTKHIIGHIGDGFLQVKWPNRQCQSTEGSTSPKDRLQSHQVHLTVLQFYTCMQ